MNNDASAALLEAVQGHVAQAQPMRIRGAGSKEFLAASTSPHKEVFDVSVVEHCGVVNYEPTELVMTARSGTPLQTVVATLREAGQCLPFEPPQPPGATLGGTLACGLSGPARPYAGAARDHVLGVRAINGKGEDLSFGGEVMKNVAGYDVSRLQIGAFGTLGLLLDISMKVLPLAETEMTLAFAQSAHDTAPMVALARRYLPITGAALIDTTRFIRLAGSEAGVKECAAQLGGDRVADAQAPWLGLRDWTHEFFQDPRPTWRISVADYAPPVALADDADGQPAATLYDWGGAQRWVKTCAQPAEVFNAAARAGGHATRYSAITESDQGLSQATRQPLQGVAAQLHQRVRASFDPHGLFNPGCFYPELNSGVK